MTTATVAHAGRSITLDDDVLARFPVPCASGDRTPRFAAAAAHLVMLPSYADVAHSIDDPGHPEGIIDMIDWDATMARRRLLAGHGFAIAEAMDTAQRFEIGWSAARRLIEETGRLKLAHGFIAGAGTDQRRNIRGTGDLVEAVVEQIAIVQAAGGTPIVLPMAWLPANRVDATAYVDVYAAIIRESVGPLLVHWLGPMFMPALEGYFPEDAFVRVMAIDAAKVRGAKLSMLDADLEVRLRSTLLERDQIMLTGDDFNFADLIAGEDQTVDRWATLGTTDVALGNFSHALLGILDGIAAPASLALRHLATGDAETFRAIMEPCQALSRVIFEAPTDRYKAGLAMLAWLNGEQDNPMLVNHLERERSVDHVLRVVELAGRAGAITNAERAALRLEAWLRDGSEGSNHRAHRGHGD